MTPCARGCCWNPFGGCSLARKCDCHAGEWLIAAEEAALKTANRITYRDPTPMEALRNMGRRNG